LQFTQVGRAKTTGQGIAIDELIGWRRTNRVEFVFYNKSRNASIEIPESVGSTELYGGQFANITTGKVSKIAPFAVFLNSVGAAFGSKQAANFQFQVGIVTIVTTGFVDV
jgi:hypothetical protein